MFSAMQSHFQRIDNSKLFQAFVIVVIVVSALSVGAHTHILPTWMENVLLLLDKGITIFFAIEIFIRFIASKGPKDFFSKGWNIFDTVIVIGSILPIGGSAIFIARLLRIFRVLRLVSMVPELRMLVNALVKAIPRMGYIALLMFVIFYIYAAIGSMLFSEINPTLWSDVSISMLTLFRVATFEDWTDVMYETMAVHPLSWIFYLSFIFLTAFIFLNMMVGVVLEVMTQEHDNFVNETTDESEKPATKAEITELKNQIDVLTELLKKQQQ